MNEPERNRADERWKSRFAELETYVRIVGHARIPHADITHSKLRSWLSTQRAMAVAGTLSAERWQRLTDIGIDIMGRDERWQMRFAQLRQYRERFGHCRVPAKWKEDVPLGHWVHVQRDFKKKGTLSAMRIALLESIGFEWSGDRGGVPRDAQWDAMFGRLTHFVREHGHSEVPRTYAADPALGRWRRAQHVAQKGGKLPADRRERLEAIGFVWKDTGKRKVNRWEKLFAQLLQFRERFGHCQVPVRWKEDLPLGNWVEAQRHFKKKGTLSAERITRLEAAGFEWDGRMGGAPREAQWDRMCGLLERFAREHGHAEVPGRFVAEPALRRWVGTQRAAHRWGTLRADRRARLEAIGLVWKARGMTATQRWEERFAQLLRFREQFGHCHVPAKWKEDVPFGHWVHVQREFKRKGMLSARRIARLEAIGFAWHRPHGARNLGRLRWAEMFAHLTAYRQEHGHTQVPLVHAAHGLGVWATNQRHLLRAGLLPEDRSAQLLSIGFELRRTRNAAVERWEQRFQQLLAFRDRFGHCRVPAKWKEDVPFAHWVGVQRQFRKNGALSAERIARLDAIGFKWRFRTGPRGGLAPTPG